MSWELAKTWLNEFIMCMQNVFDLDWSPDLDWRETRVFFKKSTLISPTKIMKNYWSQEDSIDILFLLQLPLLHHNHHQHSSSINSSSSSTTASRLQLLLLLRHCHHPQLALLIHHHSHLDPCRVATPPPPQPPLTTAPSYLVPW